MKRTNKATTTTMVRRASAALLAVCITALHLVMPVKAATAFTTQQAVGYYPDVLPYALDREYQCFLVGTDQTMFADMTYGRDTYELNIVAVFYAENTALQTQQAFAQGVTGYGSTGLSKSIVPADYAGGWRFICGDASYNIRTVEVAVLSVN